MDDEGLFVSGGVDRNRGHDEPNVHVWITLVRL